MRPFTHVNAQSVKQGCKLLAEYDGKAALNAGGTDLLGTHKGENLFEYPEALINIKTISGLEKIVESKGMRTSAVKGDCGHALIRWNSVILSPSAAILPRCGGCCWRWMTC